MTESSEEKLSPQELFKELGITNPPTDAEDEANLVSLLSSVTKEIISLTNDPDIDETVSKLAEGLSIDESTAKIAIEDMISTLKNPSQVGISTSELEEQSSSHTSSSTKILKQDIISYEEQAKNKVKIEIDLMKQIIRKARDDYLSKVNKSET
ncbi:uncharacterized protein MONOS_2558 [Monocercomonoides exilis]|uniref:uncharacterized protein n=1 Tax=Monocercomonoides exilis TaxID=2049356 RepID=UPI00355A1373|nr:hypothetical protein MONOS_2558 [Monocercomonoides exilis]|eukprot:MONOS_2558.1-p1 / transcript=MONOS_2558.1 / gene=MONOS_2558 / organism=Monocercomonoides_exilis_PA203 / gene_product=unspecified product / transcript_product=unspecified product / location=Mono_scaffold00053:129388-129990(-) / protein_length=153 / sequence_SO=supercontig / SO=protein_coding / is_pseudo=false